MSERLPSLSEAYDAIEQRIALWFEVGDDGAIYFLDPMYGGRLRPGEIPRCIREDEWCEPGIAVLDELKTRLHVYVLPGRHGSAADFAAQQRRHATMLERSPIVAIEANFDPDLLPWRTPVLANPSSGRGAYQQRQLEWAREHRKIVLPCDVDLVDSPFHQKLLSHFRLLDELPGQATADAVQNRQKLIIDRSYQYLREWAMAAQLGRWCGALEKEGALPRESETDIAVMLGAWHDEAFAVNLRACGIAATNVPPEAEDSAYAEMCRVALRTASIPPEYHYVQVPF